jgi:dCTP deaminase
VSILVDRDILYVMSSGEISIVPFMREFLGTNRYDVHLRPTLRVYTPRREVVDLGDDVRIELGVLDVRTPCATRDIEIPPEGYVLMPGMLYLASTVEYTESLRHVPIINGKSSLGRLGLTIHVTAGFGDVGFKGHWTLEMTVVYPLRIYSGMAIAQLAWFAASGTPEVPYDLKPSAKYNNRDPLPQASLMHENHVREQGEG